MKISLLIGFIATVGLVLATSESNFATISVNNLKKAFDGAKPYSDLSSAYYSVKGLVLLKEKLSPESQTEICNFVKSKVDKSNVESIFYALSLASSITNCGLTNADYQATLDSAASSSNVAELFFYTQIAQHLKLKLDAKKISKNLLDGLKKDSSILNQAYSLHIAAALGEGHKAFYDTIEDILDQADEVDKKYLQYEGGVGITSLVLEGIFELSDKIGKLPAKFDQQRLTKFVNYLSSKRHPTNIKSAYYLLRLSLKLSDNSHFVPVILNRISPVSVSSSQSNVVISVSDILGNPIKQAQFTLEALSAKSSSGSALLSAKKAFTAKSSDGSTFELKLIEQAQPAPGFYVVAVNAVAKPANANVNAKIFFLVNNQFEVKVTTQVALSDVNIGVGDRDQAIPKLTSLAVNTQLKEKLDADQQSKIYLNFQVKEKSKNTPIETHQAFVRFTDTKTSREIIFLAQSNQNKQYTAEIDLNANAKNFRYNSGVYSIELFVSDPIIENPVNWKLGEIKLIFADDQGQGNAALLEKSALYSKKPEIKHLFRQPEPTPSAVVSTVFTALCLVPLGLLVVLWLGIGFNLSKLQISLWAILFHGALAAIFGLYYCYWIKLNMFVTLRYLTLIGGVALVSGNKLLKSLASTKEKTN